MNNRNISIKKEALKQNKIATGVIMLIALIIGLIYMELLFILIDSGGLRPNYIIMFIQIFNAVLAGVAVGSCILCYNSTKKEEVFILSLVHIIFFVDIVFGHVDNSIVNKNNYIFMLTSLFRVIILLISISPFKNIKKMIINNKVKSIIIVASISILIGILKMNNIIKFDFKSIQHFINYNIFLTVIYTIVTIVYLIKSIKYKEYIYSVISASTFIFTLKWIYTIVGTINPSANIKLVSISITYVGFITFIVGIICELILTLKRNKELEYELRIFKKIADESRHNCVVIYDEIQNIKYANDKAKEYWGNKDEISESELENIFRSGRDKVDKQKLDEISNCMLKVGHWKGSVEIQDSDITLSCSIQYIYTNNKNIVIIFNDISEKLRTKKYLLEYEKMKNQEQIRNDFFANISHELRTPLNIFYSTIQLLDMKCENNPENFTQVYSSHKQCLKSNCQRMLRLINNIVDITKIDVGFKQPKFVNYDIIRLVENITLSIVNYAKPKDINILFDTEIEEHTIKCDIDMIERIMLNLLSNAIKFTRQKGNILVEISVDTQWVHISVKDDGIGIPIEIQGTIFDRFVQSDKSLTRLNEGSGIGLSIVYSIVKLNEGEIYIDSDGENGTEFEVLLPNKILEGYVEEKDDYKIDVQKIELELSDIYELYN
jgi:signal transduction histidine kinase